MNKTLNKLFYNKLPILPFKGYDGANNYIALELFDKSTETLELNYNKVLSNKR